MYISRDSRAVGRAGRTGGTNGVWTTLEYIPTSLCIREKLPNSFFDNNFTQVCPFTLVIALSVSRGCVFHSCSWISFDNFFLIL